jgi:GNAT superfamily N-acetyltransferase
MDCLTMREATPSDSDFAFRVKRAAFREYVEKVWGWDESGQRRLHDQRFASQEFRVISLAGVDVGVMALNIAADCVRVHQLFILPEHQGTGVGRKCMLLVMEEATQLRLPVRLRVLKVNPRALAFYARLGFACTGETDSHVLMECNP